MPNESPISKRQPALLEVRDLTMRFGGLTAVSKLGLQIPEGQVFSVIGPNGAGKTTVFNAITGIYEPTEGTIRFAGQRLERPVTWRLIGMATVVAILTAIAAVLMSANVDGLWHATLQRNFDFEANKLDAVEAWHDFWGYLRGELDVEQQSGRWAVVKPNGESLLGFAANKPNREAAEKLRADIAALLATAKPIEAVQRGQRYAIPAADGEQALVDFSSQGAANRAAEKLAAIPFDQAAGKRTAWFALFLGLAFGAAGTWVVWNRSRRTADVIALAGIARTFQNIRLFPNMTVLENVLVGLDRRQSHSTLRMMLHTPGIRRQEAVVRKQAIEALQFVTLDAKCNALASSLAYGDQRRLEIARALATSPKLLLLDEPAAGMNPSETVQLIELIRKIRERGVTVLLIEHHMNVVMGISDRIAVLDYGEKIAEGTPAEVRCNPRVIEAYLGKENE